ICRDSRKPAVRPTNRPAAAAAHPSSRPAAAAARPHPDLRAATLAALHRFSPILSSHAAATRLVRSALLALVLVFVLQPAQVFAQAAAGSSADAFAAGERAFAAQDYATALAAFREALASGRDGPAVRYNIGVCL